MFALECDHANIQQRRSEKKAVVLLSSEDQTLSEHLVGVVQIVFFHVDYAACPVKLAHQLRRVLLKCQLCSMEGSIGLVHLAHTRKNHGAEHRLLYGQVRRAGWGRRVLREDCKTFRIMSLEKQHLGLDQMEAPGPDRKMMREAKASQMRPLLGFGQVSMKPQAFDGPQFSFRVTGVESSATRRQPEQQA